MNMFSRQKEDQLWNGMEERSGAGKWLDAGDSEKQMLVIDICLEKLLCVPT
jgi:hypothetical protein